MHVLKIYMFLMLAKAKLPHWIQLLK